MVTLKIYSVEVATIKKADLGGSARDSNSCLGPGMGFVIRMNDFKLAIQDSGTFQIYFCGMIDEKTGSVPYSVDDPGADSGRHRRTSQTGAEASVILQMAGTGIGTSVQNDITPACQVVVSRIQAFYFQGKTIAAKIGAACQIETQAAFK